MEVWKAINGYEGLYEISSYGNVRRIANKKTCKQKPISKRKDGGGYFQVGLYKNGIRKWFRVNRLVAIAFIDNPENKLEVNHIDGIRNNNHCENLEWCTRSENEKHTYKMGRIHWRLLKRERL